MSLTLDGTTGISTTGNIVGNNISITGSFAPTALSASGNIQAANFLTSGLLSATGNVTGNYLLGNGTFITGLSASKIFNGTSEANIGTSGGNANITIGGTSNVVVVSTAGLSVSGTVQASGNITGGNISIGSGLSTAGSYSASGNITASYFIGNGYTLTSINGANVTGLNTAAISNGTSNVTISTSGGNITASVGGTPNVVVTTTTGISVAGTIQASGNITGGNILYGAGVVSGTGTVYATTISASANITGGNISTSGTATIGGFTISGNSIVSAGATLTIDPNGAGGVDGLVVIAGNLQVNGNTTTINSNVVSTNDLTINVANNATNSSQANGGGIEVGPIGSPYITWLYNNTANTWTTGGGISATGNISASYFIGNGYTLTSINGANVTGLNTAAISNGTSNVTISTSGGNITASVGGTPNVVVTATTGISVAGTVQASGNITGGNISIGSGTSTAGSYSASGQITGGNITTAGQLTVNSGANVTAIVNGAASGVGNIGTLATAFNTVFAKATTAQYADLAEVYTADATYPPGTVVSFGGTHEITISSISHNTQIAGIVSTQPAYLMNSTLNGEHTAEVALTGRVPCKVVGTIHKGDRLVASELAGVAGPLDTAQYQPGCIIGKALEEWNSGEIGTIEVAVGRT